VNINATILGQTIAFILFVWFCMRYVWPPLINAIEARQKIIEEGLTHAERAGKDLDLARAKSDENIKEAKEKASEIINQANLRSSQIIDEAKKEASVERAKIIKQGVLDVDSERNKIREDLRLQVSALVIEGAEKIIKRSIDEAENRDIIDKLVAKI